MSASLRYFCGILFGIIGVGGLITGKFLVVVVMIMVVIVLLLPNAYVSNKYIRLAAAVIGLLSCVYLAYTGDLISIVGTPICLLMGECL